MQSRDLASLKRIRIYDDEEVVVLRAGLAIVMYSTADLGEVTNSAADILDAYLEFASDTALSAIFSGGDDEYGAGFVPFDSARRSRLLHDLRSGPTLVDEDGYDFVLSGTQDGQAGHHGFRFRGTTVPDPDDFPDETSLIRLEFPWKTLDSLDVEEFVSFVQKVGELYPLSTGHAGFSFINTVAYESVARLEIPKLVPRFLGFDCAYDWMYMYMRGKVAPTHWLQLLDFSTVDRLGGRDTLGEELSEARLYELKNGLMIRGAKYPPVGDVNRRALDLGQLPRISRVLAPLCYDDPSELGLGEVEVGEGYLDRFSGRAAQPWDNG